MKTTIALLTLLCISTAFAASAVAVLELIPNESVMDEIRTEESRHLTDELRRQAVMTLPRGEYAVLTRDNIFALIPPDEKEAECLAESCAVEIGRAIGAEYVTQGKIGKFGNRLTISVELYETMGGKLLSSIVFESNDIDGLLGVIRKEAEPLFQTILLKKQPELSLPTEVKPKIDVSEVVSSSASSSGSSGKSNLAWIKWVGVGLAAVGTGIGIYGLVQNSEYKDLNDEYLTATNDFDSKWKKAEDAKSRRNIGYILGTALLSGGITIYFVF